MKVPFSHVLRDIRYCPYIKTKQTQDPQLLNCAFIRTPEAEILSMGQLGVYICVCLNFCPAYFPILKIGLNFLSC